MKVIQADIESDDEVLSSLPSEEEFEESDADEPSVATIAAAVSGDGPSKSRRKRKRDDEELEGRYMQKLEQEEARDDAKREQERESKRPKAEALVDEDVAMANGEDDSNESAEDEREDEEEADQSSDDESEDVTKLDVPKHESLATSGESDEVEKANRTVFLSNVPSEAVSDNSLRKAIRTHMSSFLEALPAEKISHKIESVRFRSVPFSNQLPKKAAFATKAVMTATTKSTNMYIVYTTKAAAREALKLNGTTILNRHIRVDSVAHPAPTQPRRCVFVGNLGFVDDESAIQAANEEEGKSKKQKKREPGDVEEGLWREFGKCGKVESVRVVRDPKTRVGKGFAYVQFTVSWRSHVIYVLAYKIRMKTPSRQHYSTTTRNSRPCFRVSYASCARRRSSGTRSRSTKHDQQVEFTIPKSPRKQSQPWDALANSWVVLERHR